MTDPDGNPGTAIMAISRRGAEFARTLFRVLPGANALYLDRRFLREDDSATAFDLPARPVVQDLFGRYDRLVLFMPVGAAIRLLAPALQHKHRDPAVVGVDDGGRFAVSLLSGHLGGADALSQEVAQILGATAVITSGSHVAGTLAVDLLGKEFDWVLEADDTTITRASADVVNGQPVGIWQQTGEPGWWPEDKPLPENLQIYSSLEALANSPSVAALVITDQSRPESSDSGDYAAELAGKYVVVYRPRSLVAGVGCRRGVPVEELDGLLVEIFQSHNLSLDSLKCLATADVKEDEPGILQLADKYGVPVRCFTPDELNGVFELLEVMEADSGPENVPTKSEAPHRLLGVWGVSEPAALLASGASRLLVPKTKTSRATMAVARIPFS